MTLKTRVFNIKRRNITEHGALGGFLNGHCLALALALIKRLEADLFKFIRGIVGIYRLKAGNPVSAETLSGSIERKLPGNHGGITLDQMSTLYVNNLALGKKGVSLHSGPLNQKNTIMISNPFPGQFNLIMEHPGLTGSLGHHQLLLERGRPIKSQAIGQNHNGTDKDDYSGFKPHEFLPLLTHLLFTETADRPLSPP